MKRYIVIILIIGNSSLFSQEKAQLWDIFAVNHDIAFACSNIGSLYKTSNGGVSWEINENLLGIGRSLCSIYFPDEKHGWMITRSGGYVLSTNDAGLSWESFTLPSENELSLYEVFFSDSLSGWICGCEIVRESLMLVYTQAVLWSTNDGGKSWNKQSGFNNRSGTINRSFYFTKDSVGWMGNRDRGYGTLLKSIDRGLTWQAESIQNINQVEKIYFLDNKNGWAVSNYYSHLNNETWFTQLLHTIDGGETWNIQKTDFEYPINDIFFTDDSTGFAIHSFHRDYVSPAPTQILVSSDSGATWRTHSSYNDRLGGIHFVDSNIGWIVGENELILKTIDGGLNWEKQENISVINNISRITPLGTFELSQNYPNPFNALTTIKYTITKPSMISLKIYDIIGREVDIAVNQFQKSGDYSISFNGDYISSGFYFYTLKIDNKFSFTKKMLLIR